MGQKWLTPGGIRKIMQPRISRSARADDNSRRTRMDQSTGNMKSRQPQTFLFRGNAVAAGGYLTKLKGVAIELDRQHVTVHGESNLPMIGGISHSLVQNPGLRFPPFISFNHCSTIVERFGSR